MTRTNITVSAYPLTPQYSLKYVNDCALCKIVSSGVRNTGSRGFIQPLTQRITQRLSQRLTAWYARYDVCSDELIKAYDDVMAMEKSLQKLRSSLDQAFNKLRLVIIYCSLFNFDSFQLLCRQHHGLCICLSVSPFVPLHDKMKIMFTSNYFIIISFLRI